MGVLTLTLNKLAGTRAIEIQTPKGPVTIRMAEKQERGVQRVLLTFDADRDIPITRIGDDGREKRARGMRPRVGIEPGPAGEPRMMPLDDRQTEILSCIAGLAHAIGPDDLAALVIDRRWSEGTLHSLLAAGLLVRLADGSVRITELGKKADKAYARWARA